MQYLYFTLIWLQVLFITQVSTNAAWSHYFGSNINPCCTIITGALSICEMITCAAVPSVFVDDSSSLRPWTITCPWHVKTMRRPLALIRSLGSRSALVLWQPCVRTYLLCNFIKSVGATLHIYLPHCQVDFAARPEKEALVTPHTVWEQEELGATLTLS